MARKTSSTISEDDFEALVGESPRRSRSEDESPLDARLLEIDDDAESPFLRGQRRVPVRRGPLPLPRNARSWIKPALLLALMLAILAMAWLALDRYGARSWRFTLDSSDNIVVSGAGNVSRAQVLEVMASDIDRNVFFVPLEQRKQQLERIPWVKSATVMRLLPNRLKIALTERTPVAFADINSHIYLIDAGGVLMEMPPAQKYSFPVIVGMSDTDPLSTRAARMKIYSRFMKDLDSDGGHYSANISDIDLSDPDDVKATVTDPQGAVLVHLGSSNFLERFRTYVTHVQEWRSQFPNLQSVSLRYDHQVIVNPDLASAATTRATATATDNTTPVESGTPAKTNARRRHKK